jgi:hypothetical protein
LAKDHAQSIARSARRAGSAIGTIDATIGHYKVAAALGIHIEPVEVEKISVPGAQSAAVANRTNLDWAIWGGIDGRPRVAAITSGGDIKVPDTLEGRA